jgi:hypothetical protein
MIDALPLLLSDEGYQISRSVRLRNSASASFSRTPASAGNRKTWTWSGWIKRGLLGSTQSFFGNYFASNNNSQFYVMFDANNCLNVGLFTLSALVTTAVYRDPSSWYHVVVLFDSTQATAANRLRLFVNGVEITAFSTDNRSTFTQNGDFAINAAQATFIGYNNVGGFYFDGYLTEINFINGYPTVAGVTYDATTWAALNVATLFGETNPVTGVWQPKKYTGTYGTNGFYLNFSNPSAATAAAIGADYSGNGNNWTPNNITLSPTTSVSYDSMLDVPTQWADGGNGRGNYCVLNRLAEYGTIGQMGCTNGNLVSSPGGSTTNKGFLATTGIDVGMLVYAEATFTTTSGDNNGGVALTPQGNPNPGDTATSMRWGDAGFIRTNNVGTAYGSALVTNDVVMMAVNYESATSCKVWLGKNGTWFASGNPATGANPGVTLNPAAVTMFIASYHFANLAVSNWTFGQRPFAYTPPTGFKALNTLNLPQPTILKGNQYFDAFLNSGNGTSRTDVINFQPDLVWTKSRSASGFNIVQDSVRGAGNRLITDGTFAELFDSTYGSFNSNGFTFGAQANVNTNGVSYVDWFWKANGTPAVTNTAGSITSTISAGATQGFSIVTYTGTGANATVGHGLGVAPSMVIVKRRNTSGSNWPVYHASLANAAGNYLSLNTTDAVVNDNTAWNGGSPTFNSSVFSLGTLAATNQNTSTYVAYCFAAVAGFSAFGSYTGNGSTDGPFVFCGFRPRFILTKGSSTTGSWWLYDTARSTYNEMTDLLRPDLSNADVTQGFCDALSNGFKIRNSGNNTSGQTYIFMAFAENPFKNALAR